MKKAKKLLVTLLILTFVLSTVSVGFAASSTSSSDTAVDVKKLTSDIEDKDVKAAVLRLAAFSIVNGMEDGKYHPSDSVTREQFAKILVTSLKMDAAAKAATGRSSFKDVEASRWSAGYINVAVGQGLIKGYPDGTFKPANQVSYAEAITMLVRALGYKDSFLSGSWPGNYLAKAAEKEITKYVKFSDATGFANRGDVAILVNNTLDAKVVKIDTLKESGIEYYESDKTLLEDKLNITKYEDVRIVANNRLDDSLENNEVTVFFTKDTDDNKYDKNNDADFECIDGFNVEPILGEEVTIYLNDDDEIVYAESESDDKAAFDYVEGDVASSGKISKVSLVKLDDDYAFDSNATVYVTQSGETKKIDPDDQTSGFFNGMVGKIVIKNDKIVFADFMDVTEEIDNWMLVETNKDGLITGISMDDESFELDLTKDSNYDGVMVFDIDGNALSVDDIEKGNILYVAKTDIDGDDYAIVRVVTDNKIEGTFDKVKSDRITVGGKEIKFTKVGSDIRASYSIDNGDSISRFDFSKPDVMADMEDADDEDIVAYTDAVGRIAYFVTTAKAVSGYKYGVITRVFTDSDKLKIYTITDEGKGDEVTYAVEKSSDMDSVKVIDPSTGLEKSGTYTKPSVAAGQIIKFKLNKDGEIADGEIYVIPQPQDTDAAWILTKDFGKDTVTAVYNNGGSAKSFSVDSDTVIIDAKNLQTNTNSTKLTISVDDNFSVVAWKDLAEDTKVTEPFYVILDKDGVDAKALVFFGNGVGSAAEDYEALYVIDTWYKGGDMYAKVQRYGNSVEEFKLDHTISKDERPYVGKVQADGDLSIGSDSDFTEYYGIITGKDSSTITADVYAAGSSTKQTMTFKISSSTLVYEEDTKKSTSNLHEKDAIYLVVENGVSARVIERLVDTEKSKVENNQSPY